MGRLSILLTVVTAQVLLVTAALSQTSDQDRRRLWEAQRTAIVKISVWGDNPEGQPVPTSHGTGIIVRSSGLVVTALHVVKHSYDWQKDPDGTVHRHVQVTRLDRNGRPQDLGYATVDEFNNYDLAILHLNAWDLTDNELDQSLPAQFSQIVALVWDPDTPLPTGPVPGQLIISEFPDRLKLTLQTAVVLGNSGTPIFSNSGKLIGIITNQDGSAALAVPIYVIRPFLPVPTSSQSNAVDVKTFAQEQTIPAKEVLTPPEPITKPKLPTGMTSNGPPAGIPPIPAGCLGDSELRDSVGKFILGEDLDKLQRQKIYARWGDINCYILPIALNGDNKLPTSQQARAIRLLINVIINDSGVPGEPEYWQPNGPNKRDFSHSLPFIQERDIRTIISLIPSDDPTLRSEVLRFVKMLPVDSVEQSLAQKLAQMNTLPLERRERYAIAASFLYYNRMVEWLDAPNNSDKKSVQRQLEVDFAKGQAWMKDIFFASGGAASYKAMLLYGKAIVEREQQLTTDLGKSTFSAMLVTLRSTAEAYPSNPRHIAQALAFVWNPVNSRSNPAVLDILKQAGKAVPLPVSTLLTKNATPGQKYPLYVSPGSDYPLNASVSSVDRGRLLLRTGDWVLVSANDKIGWIDLPQPHL